MIPVPNPEPIHADPDHLAPGPEHAEWFSGPGDVKPRACLGCCMVEGSGLRRDGEDLAPVP
jgi:hypothetical protein